jgi:hypothetical protein
MYYWRTHSTIISLNSADDGDFAGGDFFYESWSDHSSARVRVPPKVGQAAAFSAGVENVHGVEAVTKGTRCQLSLWMTNDLRRASHANELRAAEAILNGKLPDKSSIAEAVVSDKEFGHMCRRAVQSSSDFVDGTKQTDSRNPVTELKIPGDSRTVNVEVLSDLPRPQISLIRGLISKDEIEHIIGKASPNFKAAVVFEGSSLTTAKYRTSSTSWLRDDPNDAVVTQILERIKLVTGLTLYSAEELQVARYVDKDHGRYEPHFDWGTTGRVTRDFSWRKGEDAGSLGIFHHDIDFHFLDPLRLVFCCRHAQEAEGTGLKAKGTLSGYLSVLTIEQDARVGI